MLKVRGFSKFILKYLNPVPRKVSSSFNVDKGGCCYGDFRSKKKILVEKVDLRKKISI